MKEFECHGCSKLTSSPKFYVWRGGSHPVSTDKYTYWLYCGKCAKTRTGSMDKISRKEYYRGEMKTMNCNPRTMIQCLLEEMGPKELKARFKEVIDEIITEEVMAA